MRCWVGPAGVLEPAPATAAAADAPAAAAADAAASLPAAAAAAAVEPDSVVLVPSLYGSTAHTQQAMLYRHKDTMSLMFAALCCASGGTGTHIFKLVLSVLLASAQATHSHGTLHQADDIKPPGYCNTTHLLVPLVVVGDLRQGGDVLGRNYSHVVQQVAPVVVVGERGRGGGR